MISTVLIFCFGFWWAPSVGHAASIYTSVGMMNENLTRTTDDVSGEASFWGTANDYPVFIGMEFQAENQSAWAPRVGYTFFPRRTEDASTEVEYLILGLPYTKQLWGSNVDGMIGTSFFQHTHKATGGKVRGKNGSTTRIYYQPDYDQTAKYMTLDFGLGYKMPPFKLAIEVFVLSAFSQKRSYNALLQLTYFWGESNGSSASSSSSSEE